MLLVKRENKRNKAAVPAADLRLNEKFSTSGSRFPTYANKVVCNVEK